MRLDKSFSGLFSGLFQFICQIDFIFKSSLASLWLALQHRFGAYLCLLARKSFALASMHAIAMIDCSHTDSEADLRSHPDCKRVRPVYEHIQATRASTGDPSYLPYPLKQTKTNVSSSVVNLPWAK
mgnify:CR=1 FL=1